MIVVGAMLITLCRVIILSSLTKTKLDMDRSCYNYQQNCDVLKPIPCFSMLERSLGKNCSQIFCPSHLVHQWKNGSWTPVTLSICIGGTFLLPNVCSALRRVVARRGRQICVFVCNQKRCACGRSIFHFIRGGEKKGYTWTLKGCQRCGEPPKILGAWKKVPLHRLCNFMIVTKGMKSVIKLRGLVQCLMSAKHCIQVVV